MNVTAKGPSKIAPGAYDILDFIQVHIYSPVGAGLTLEYSRFAPNGTKIFSCHGLYGVTNNDGKWGIEWVSTIFKPANQVGRDQSYNDPILNTALHESHRDHVMARRYNDLPELRQSVFDPFPHGSLSLGPSVVRDATGKARQEYRTEGVTSRLRYSKGDTRKKWTSKHSARHNFPKTSGEGPAAGHSPLRPQTLACCTRLRKRAISIPVIIATPKMARSFRSIAISAPS